MNHQKEIEEARRRAGLSASEPPVKEQPQPAPRSSESTSNTQYLASVRSRSCYPTFRAFVTMATVVTYLLAAFAAVAGFVSQNGVGVLIGIVVAVVLVILAKVAQEVSLMVADIADATIDAASRGASGASAPSVSTMAASKRPQPERPASPATGPVGTCPNCRATVPLASLECTQCNASFGPGSAWSVQPAS